MGIVTFDCNYLARTIVSTLYSATLCPSGQLWAWCGRGMGMLLVNAAQDYCAQDYCVVWAWDKAMQRKIIARKIIAWAGYGQGMVLDAGRRSFQNKAKDKVLLTLL